MPNRERRPTDRRRHAAATERNLILGGFGLALLVGGLLIWRFWGGGAAVLGLLCMGGIISLFALLWLLLKGIEVAGRSR
jgi:hypothetical protein